MTGYQAQEEARIQIPRHGHYLLDFARDGRSGHLPCTNLEPSFHGRGPHSPLLNIRYASQRLGVFQWPLVSFVTRMIPAFQEVVVVGSEEAFVVLFPIWCFFWSSDNVEGSNYTVFRSLHSSTDIILQVPAFITTRSLIRSCDTFRCTGSFSFPLSSSFTYSSEFPFVVRCTWSQILP